MGNLIWADMENYMGKGWKDETDAIYNTTEVHTGPENKRECPCDTCPLFEQCAAKGTECSAFRNWGTNGDFKDADVQRLLRAAAQRGVVMSTKEMTAQEIAELNKEFRIANASTQWKFMQTPEYAKLPLAARCTVERNCLSYYFDKLSEGMTDWKNPICARIPTEDFDVYDRACAYFTGTELQTMNTYPNGTSKVFAKGYYMMGE